MRLSSERVRYKTSVWLSAGLLLALCAGLGAQTATPAPPSATNPNQGAAAVIQIPRLDGTPKLEDFLEMKPGPGVAQQMSKVELLLSDAQSRLQQ